MTPEQVDDAYLNLAMQILCQENLLMEEQGDDYKPPVVVGLTNGALPVLSGVGRELSEYGFDIDPFLLTTETYGTGHNAGEPKVTKGFSDEELSAMNGRRVIVVDDMWDTGTTATFVQDHIMSEMVGTITHESDEGKAVVTELITPQPEDIQFVFLITKQPDVTSKHTPPTMTVLEVSGDTWTIGAGGNGFDADGQSVGRYSPGIYGKPRPGSE